MTRAPISFFCRPAFQRGRARLFLLLSTFLFALACETSGGLSLWSKRLQYEGFRDASLAAYEHKDCKAAVEKMEQALVVAEQIKDQAPDKEISDFILSEAHKLLGQAISGPCGDPLGALPSYERALAISLERYGNEDLNTAYIRNDFGRTQFDAGKLEEAEAMLLKAEATIEEAGKGDWRDALPSLNLGQLYEREGSQAKAEAFYRISLDRAEAAYLTGIGPLYRARYHFEIYSDFLDSEGRDQDIEALWRRFRRMSNDLTTDPRPGLDERTGEGAP